MLLNNKQTKIRALEGEFDVNIWFTVPNGLVSAERDNGLDNT